MRFHLLLLTCLLPSLLQASPQQDRSDMAYSLGAKLGERLRGEVPDLDVQALLDGLRQAYHDEPLRLPQSRIERLLQDHEAALYQQSKNQSRQQALTKEQAFFDNERAKPDTRELSAGVLARELHPGTGRLPSANSRVRVRYRGELLDGSLVDQSQGPQWFRLGSLIKGWQIALQAMPVGATWRVLIPADQAYGIAGAGDLIPPDAPLVFEIELLDAAD